MDAPAHPGFTATPSNESPDRIRYLLERNLQDVFGEGDALRRRAAIDELYTEDCLLYVPPGIIQGRDQLDSFSGTLRGRHPDFVYTPIGKPQALQNGGRQGWGSGLPGTEPDYFGLDVIIVRDGRIAALYVFIEEESAEYRRSKRQE